MSLQRRLKVIANEVFDEITSIPIDIDLENPSLLKIELPRGITIECSYSELSEKYIKRVVKFACIRYQVRYNASDYYLKRLDLFEKYLNKHTDLIFVLKSLLKKFSHLYSNRLPGTHHIELF